MDEISLIFIYHLISKPVCIKYSLYILLSLHVSSTSYIYY